MLLGLVSMEDENVVYKSLPMGIRSIVIV
jgi:hypothetical protein